MTNVSIPVSGTNEILVKNFSAKSTVLTFSAIHDHLFFLKHKIKFAVIFLLQNFAAINFPEPCKLILFCIFE
jgi:hypothetical protein